MIKLGKILGSDFKPIDHYFPAKGFLCTQELGDIFNIIVDQNSAKYGVSSEDLLNSRSGDHCPSCYNLDYFKPLEETKAIEVGHTFFLDRKYSEALNSTFKTANDKAEFFKMGCYGIGVSRLISAIVETNHDEHGISWPASVAPYQAVLIVTTKTLPLIEEIMKIIDIDRNEIVIDDRDLSFGQKMQDARLVGYPNIIVAGDLFLRSKKLEIHDRKLNSKYQCFHFQRS